VPPPATLEEIERQGTQRVLRASWPPDLVEQMVRERLEELGRSLRLPGFRPGKIPVAVLEQRYRTRALTDVINRLTSQAAGDLLKQGNVASAVEAESESSVRFIATHLPDLPAFDPTHAQLERLTADDPALAPALDQHLHRQILDLLDAAYDFPLAAALIDRELHAIHAAVGAEWSESDALEWLSTAERRVRLGAVVAELARRNGIVVPGEASRQREQAIEDAVIQWILARASVSERPATAAELADLQD
jgi:FKBP-type peptidyl-prolyl cis-trans isomerase (trigger factor)